LAGCGRNSEDLAPIRLIHTPPVRQMTAEQLRSLSMECEKYSRNESMRGRYEAAYCEDAIAAWGDSPLQIVNLEKSASPTVATPPAAPTQQGVTSTKP